jgi:obg-like ATPase 1
MSEEGYILATKLEQGLIKLEDFDTDQKKLIKHAIKVKKWMKDNAPDSELCFLSAAFEHRLSLMEDDAAALEECKRLNTYSALPKIITTMRAALDLASFFTTGEDEVRQWTIRKGIKAPAAAGVIHTDFEKTFIQAIAYNYSVLREYGDEASVKAAGKIMTKGKDYVVNDGDILLIKAGAAKK